MASYRNIEPTSLYSATISAAATYSSRSLDIAHLQCAAFQAVWTGTLTGSLIIEASLDGTNFDDLGISITAPPAGSAGHYLINMSDLAVKYVRMTYTHTSGTGLFTVYGSAKGA